MKSVHPTRIETLTRAVVDILAPTAKELRALGYSAELLAEEGDGVLVKLVVVVVDKVPDKLPD